MAVTAVTGDIGAGKSTVSRMFAGKLSCERLDADSIVAKLWTRDDVKEVFLNRWGDSILDDDGSISKSQVSRIIFTSHDEYAFCNEIIHALVMGELKASCEGSENVMNIILEIPLLPETGRPDWINHVVYVTASYDVRLQRCLTQRGWDVHELLRRESFLKPYSERVSISDCVISNNGSLEELQTQVNEAAAIL